MSDIITMTQDEFDELIEKRIARVRKEYEDDGQQSWKALSRQWEGRSKTSQKALREITEDRDWWRARAKFNNTHVAVLQAQHEKLLDRLAGTN